VSRARHLATALLAGSLFGVGLVCSGMTDPGKVLGFLDIGGPWNPSLAFVMAGAVGVHFVAYRLIRRRSRPLFAEAFVLPTQRRIDTKLLFGSALFGVGWGLAGYCPGPAIVSLGSGAAQAFVFVGAMLVGLFAGKQIESRLQRTAEEPVAPGPLEQRAS
jgi:uncharacterized protein